MPLLNDVPLTSQKRFPERRFDRKSRRFEDVFVVVVAAWNSNLFCRQKWNGRRFIISRNGVCLFFLRL